MTVPPCARPHTLCPPKPPPPPRSDRGVGETTIQERATKVSHGGTARIAKVGAAKQGSRSTLRHGGYSSHQSTSRPAPGPALCHHSTACFLCSPHPPQAYGEENLAKLCGLIAADESRHEAAYTRTMDAIFKA